MVKESEQVEAIVIERLFQRTPTGLKEELPLFVSTRVGSTSADNPNFFTKIRLIIWQIRQTGDCPLNENFLGIIIQSPHFPAVARTIHHPKYNQPFSPGLN